MAGSRAGGTHVAQNKRSSQLLRRCFMSKQSRPKSQRIFPFLPKDKDVYESECVQRVLKQLPGYESVSIVKRESPDVLMETNSSTIGIEVCDFVRGQTEEGSRELRKENVKEKIADYARYWFELDDKDLRLSVTITWLDSSDPIQSQAEAIGKNIAQDVCGAIPEGEYSHNKIIYSDKSQSLVRQLIGSIYIMRLPSSLSERGW